jgi:hypothetical protein
MPFDSNGTENRPHFVTRLPSPARLREGEGQGEVGAPHRAS